MSFLKSECSGCFLKQRWGKINLDDTGVTDSFKTLHLIPKQFNGNVSTYGANKYIYMPHFNKMTPDDMKCQDLIAWFRLFTPGSVSERSHTILFHDVTTAAFPV